MKPIDVLVTLVGVGFLLYGLQAVYPPLAPIVLGVLLISSATVHKKGEGA